MGLEEVRRLNPNLKIIDLEDSRFKEYGKPLLGFEFEPLFQYVDENATIPQEGNSYVASMEQIEDFEVIKSIQARIYGRLEVEAGVCAGQNTALTGVEYHQGSEVIIAVTDCMIIIGRVQDMIGNTYESSQAEVFYMKRGEAVELYGTTLHYTPCKVEERGFMTIVVLLKGTNMPVERVENSLLTKKNKWFITHETQKAKIESGAYPGLKGNLIDIKVK
jgi:hypothetical protein